MMKRKRLWTLLVGAGLLGGSSSAGGGRSPESPLPNIVIILADDLGYGDPGSYNSASRIPTPNIDALADQGMRFMDAHSPSSVCSPTRYGLLTGRYAWRTPLKKEVLWPYDPPLIEPDRLTLAKMLKQHGYATGCIGKWHLGWRWMRLDGTTHQGPYRSLGLEDKEMDLSKPITGGPKAAGFDTYFGMVPNFPPYCFIENERIAGPLPDRPRPDSMYGWPGRMQKGWILEEILPELTRRSLAFIENHVKGKPGQPFFLYFPLTAPHTPIVPSKPWLGRSQGGDYGDFVAQLDGTVGAVMKVLNRLEIADNTLLIFTSDNGSIAAAGNPKKRGTAWGKAGSVTEMFGHDPNRPWRGLKGEIHEGGHRVPFVVRWPGIIKPNSISHEMICLTDLMATIAALVGHTLPGNAGEDSVNLYPVIRGERLEKPIREAVVHHSYNGTFSIRQGDWKLIAGNLGTGGFVRASVIEPTPGGPQGQLYNIVDDPSERRNLWSEKPAIVSRLTSLMDLYRKQGRSTRID